MKTDNKLIAEFMGIKVLTKEEFNQHPDHERLNVGEYSILEYQRYDKEWNWIMPVVGKILYMPREYEGHYSYLSKIENGLLQVNHGMIYEGVTEFIKWFNAKLTKHEN